MKNHRLLLALTLIAATTPTLQGCFPVVATGVAAGTLMVADRRIAENYIADEGIENRTLLRINERLGDKVHVNVTSYNLNVMLTGEAFNEASKSEAQSIAQSVPNVKGVVNEIRVAPTSSLSARSNDAYITSKVKARFVEANRFHANNVKVVTEASVVYLLGMVSQAEADAATELARTTTGVTKVVRLFEYISTDQAKKFDSRPPEPAKPVGAGN